MATRAHVVGHGLAAKEDGFQVDVHDVIPVFFFHVKEFLDLDDAGIVEKYIDSTEV